MTREYRMLESRLGRWFDKVWSNAAQKIGRWWRFHQAGVRPGEIVRDGLTDQPLAVRAVPDRRARMYAVERTSLNQYGQNKQLACGTDYVVECRYPGDDRTFAFPTSRLQSLSFGTGDTVRDRFTGNRMTVEGVRLVPAREVEVDGTPLPEMGVNASLDCDDDWVVDCRFPRSDTTYAFPLSRVVAGPYPTRPKRHKEVITNSRECYSCDTGIKDYVTAAACQECRKRIRARDGYTCQQKGCEATSDLQVHHLRYEPNLSGTVPDRLLITLCERCHERRHGIQ